MKKYLIVNSVTALSLIMGFTAVFFAFRGYLYPSFGFALLAFVLDALDGYLARKLKAESRFGAIFDTVSDIFVYLLYPAVILLNKFEMNNVVGIFFILVFLSAGVFRLIRFTTNGFLVDGEKKYYLGMPVFFSIFLLAIMILVNILGKALLPVVGPLLLFFMSIMMVTKFKFRKP